MDGSGSETRTSSSDGQYAPEPVMRMDVDNTTDKQSTSPMSIDGAGNSASSPVSVRTDLYEERATSNAGIAIFATSTIPAGTRIFCEDSLVTLKEDRDLPDLIRVVQALPADKQKEFWSLAAYNRRHEEVDWIPAMRASYTGPSEEFEDLLDKTLHAWKIYETNRFTVRNAAGVGDSMGVFAKAARLNHSCAPNVFHRYNYQLNRLTIHAIRTIPAGEEINTSYIDVCHPTAERRRLLRHWGFKCRCKLCQCHDAARDHRRKKLEELTAKMKRNERKRPMDGWQQWDYAKALSTVEEIVQLMEAEGMCESDTTGEAYSNAAEYCMAVGWWGPAKQWAQKACEVEERCLGKDSAEWTKAKVLLEAAEKGG